MARNETRPLQPAIVNEDKDASAALKKIHGYAPNNPDSTVEKVQASSDAMASSVEAEAQAEAAVDAARDNTIASEWAFHNLILGDKEPVAGQFGEDSNQLRSLGLKNQSEYQYPQRTGNAWPTPVPVG